MDKTRKIMVLLSAYNGEKYIEEQIDSIFNQKDCVIKLVVRDDGSSDNTLQILSFLSTKYDIKIIVGQNIGYVASFFELLSYALANNEGFDFFSLADQDDVWDDNKLSIACKAIEKENQTMPLLYGSTSRLVTEDLRFISITQKEIRPISFFNTIIQNFIPGHSQVLNKPMLELVGKNIDNSQIYVHDSFIANCAVLCGKIIFDNEPHTNYRQHSSNQLGSEKSCFSWFSNRMKRLKRGDGQKYAIQIRYICEKLVSFLDDNQKKEMQFFNKSNKNFFTRLHYIFHSKLYRQKRFESFAFKIHYLFGGYKIKN